MFPRFSSPGDVENAFYRAFQELDLPLMGQVWSEDSDSVCLHPGGDLLQGKAAVMQSWSDIFGSTHRPSMVHRTIQITSNDDLSIHLVEELIRPSADPQGKATRIIATNIYRRSRGAWQMITHQASLPIMKARASTGRLH